MNKTDYYQGEQIQFIIRGSKKKKDSHCGVFYSFHT